MVLFLKRLTASIASQAARLPRLGALRRSSNATAYETRAQPAPGVPFHVAIPVHNIAVAKQFYGETLGLEEGRSSTKWQDYAMHGHQVVVHCCVEINQCAGRTDAAVLARSSGEEPASPRHRAGVALMAWRRTRRFSTNAP